MDSAWMSPHTKPAPIVCDRAKDVMLGKACIMAELTPRGKTSSLNLSLFFEFLSRVCFGRDETFGESNTLRRSTGTRFGISASTPLW
jgi:hypothetical protein